ncbi:hypothetical protein [Streptomyces microflavus]|uniref:hypothetical protein n=1 Tax=Streptomyces microflavus TaxID=1919 RepID=UPI0036EC510A
MDLHVAYGEAFFELVDLLLEAFDLRGPRVWNDSLLPELGARGDRNCGTVGGFRSLAEVLLLPGLVDDGDLLLVEGLVVPLLAAVLGLLGQLRVRLREVVVLLRKRSLARGNGRGRLDERTVFHPVCARDVGQVGGKTALELLSRVLVGPRTWRAVPVLLGIEARPGDPGLGRERLDVALAAPWNPLVSL